MSRSIIAGVCVAALSAACESPISPAGPSALAPGVPSLSSATAGDAAVSANRTAAMIPFKGSLEGEYGEPGEPPLITESITGRGHATHLGRYTLDILETVNVAEFSATGTFTFTAADGDQVRGDFVGRAQLGPLVTIVENATVRGGTGRFASARGTFVIDRVYDPVTRTTTGSFDGTISSAAAR